ncbi:hypothetical protein [Georgenia sp. H159]|nr:hypothetical protein [Georgenia sp. H159]
MNTEPSLEPAEPPPEEDRTPSELESALLTIVLFGGLVVFAVGCMFFLW